MDLMGPPSIRLAKPEPIKDRSNSRCSRTKPWFGSDDAGGAGVASWVVGFAVLPGSSEDAYPGAGQDPLRVSMCAPTLTGFVVDGARPCAGMAGVVGETGDSQPQVLVTGPSEDD